MREFFKTPWVQVPLIVVGLAAIFWFFWPKGVPRPDESLRQVHPSGYSVVVPPGYTVTIDRTGNARVADSIAAEDPNYSSFAPRFQVDRFRGTPDFERLTQRRFKPGGSFMGRDALVLNGPRGPYWHYRVVFEQDGEWFEVGLAAPDFHDVPNDRWYDYFKSFRYDRPAGGGAPAAPATAPDGNPATTGAADNPD